MCFFPSKGHSSQEKPCSMWFQSQQFYGEQWQTINTPAFSCLLQQSITPGWQPWISFPPGGPTTACSLSAQPRRETLMRLNGAVLSKQEAAVYPLRTAAWRSGPCQHYPDPWNRSAGADKWNLSTGTGRQPPGCWRLNWYEKLYAGSSLDSMFHRIVSWN